jgi:hypothetical protein
MLMTILNSLPNEGGIVAIIITIVTSVMSGLFIKYKNKFSQAVKLGHAIVELSDEVEKSIADNTISSDEIARLKQELTDVKDAWKVLVKKQA